MRDSSTPTSCRRRCSSQAVVSGFSRTGSMHIVILSARTGWQTDELCRALAARGHIGCVLPYEGLVARLGGAARGLASERTSVLDADAVLARIIPIGLARTDHLPRRRAALDRGARHPGDELAARDRALRRQVLHDGAAASRPGCRCPRRSSASAPPMRSPRCGRWATRSSSRSSDRWATGWCASPTPTSRSASSSRSSRSAASSTCSAPSIMAAATFAPSSSADA